ncbi:MAG: hypothetical protein ACI9MC_003473 [Kiritimatiellia bacterium]|jgi:hypothetical protein
MTGTGGIMSRLILVALLTGCAPTIAEVGAVDDDTDEIGTEAPPVSEFAGPWAGPFDVSVDFGRGPQPMCLGDVSGEVDNDGTLTASGLCEVQFGPGGDSSYELAVDGIFEDEGPFAGRVIFTALNDRLPPLDETELLGESSSGDLAAEGIVVVRFGVEFDAPVLLTLLRQ